MPPTQSRRLTDVVRALVQRREHFSSLMLTSTIAAIASLAVVAALLAGARQAALLPLLLVLQIALIGCIVGARAAISNRLLMLEQLTEADPATGCLNRRGF